MAVVIIVIVIMQVFSIVMLIIPLRMRMRISAVTYCFQKLFFYISFVFFPVIRVEINGAYCYLATWQNIENIKSVLVG
jgi:nitrate reductase NapE component